MNGAWNVDLDKDGPHLTGCQTISAPFLVACGGRWSRVSIDPDAIMRCRMLAEITEADIGGVPDELMNNETDLSLIQRGELQAQEEMEMYFVEGNSWPLRDRPAAYLRAAVDPRPNNRG